MRGTKQIGRRIDKEAAKPLMYVERREEGPNGQRPGTIATDPIEVDAIVRKAWNKVYDGDGKDQERQAIKYLAKYSRWLYKEKQEAAAKILHAIPADPF